jgi:hypothetical protein
MGLLKYKTGSAPIAARTSAINLAIGRDPSRRRTGQGSAAQQAKPDVLPDCGTAVLLDEKCPT